MSLTQSTVVTCSTSVQILEPVSPKGWIRATGQANPSLSPLAKRTIRSCLNNVALNLWLMTKEDTPTFVIPNTVFGICAALAGSQLIERGGSFLAALTRIPLVLLFNWSNLLIFNLANQRLPESAHEDKLNKPWRPVPSGRMTCEHVRRSMLLAIPLVLAFNHFVLDVGTETALLYTLTWLYNDLKGGDEDWILRNVIIAFAFGLYNLGSLKVAVPGPAHVTSKGYLWIAIISGVILTTMHVQDLKDTDGDQSRGRKSAPIVLGERLARWTLAVPICLWTVYCARFWCLRWRAVAAVALAGYIAWRCLRISGKKADRKTWHLWCLWTAVLYMMPLLR